MGLKGEAAIVGYVELPAERKPTGDPLFSLEQYARLSAAAIADAGLSAGDINGIITPGIREASSFVPSTVVEYLGIPVNFAEIIDLGGACAAAMVWRAAAAIELGLCDAVLCITPGGTQVPQSDRKPRPSFGPWGASSNLYGSPQAEFDIPYGNLGQNGPYGQMARLYGSLYGYDARAAAKISVDQRVNACATPGAAFYGKPITVEDVLASPMIADPLHMLEIVMPVSGGAGVVVASADVARRAKNRPVWIDGFGERVAYKTPTYAQDLMNSPMVQVAESAFAMAGIGRSDIDMASIYDCYTITVLMSLEDAGFCAKGTAMDFVSSHDLTFRGDFPLNTGGGQLGYGQAGLAGGMHHVCDATRQIQGRAGAAQVANCNRAFVSGNGGIMSEQTALVLRGD
ncbi:MAG: transporter [Jatrophihabitantaceae bacterium]|nr:transporter [Jatrophihabitantaceae bacterium]